MGLALTAIFLLFFGYLFMPRGDSPARFFAWFLVQAVLFGSVGGLLWRFTDWWGQGFPLVAAVINSIMVSIIGILPVLATLVGMEKGMQRFRRFMPGFLLYLGGWVVTWFRVGAGTRNVLRWAEMFPVWLTENRCDVVRLPYRFRRLGWRLHHSPGLLFLWRDWPDEESGFQVAVVTRGKMVNDLAVSSIDEVSGVLDAIVKTAGVRGQDHAYAKVWGQAVDIYGEDVVGTHEFAHMVSS